MFPARERCRSGSVVFEESGGDLEGEESSAFFREHLNGDAHRVNLVVVRVAFAGENLWK